MLGSQKRMNGTKMLLNILNSKPMGARKPEKSKLTEWHKRYRNKDKKMVKLRITYKCMANNRRGC